MQLAENRGSEGNSLPDARWTMRCHKGKMKFSHQHKIVILDDDVHRRDFLRAVVHEAGAVPYFFDKPAIFLDNLAPIAPHAVITGPLPREQAYRVILSIKARNRGLPLLVLSADPDLERFASNNDFKEVTFLRGDAEPWEVEGSLGTLIHRSAFEERSEEAAPPVLIGHSAAMVKLKKKVDMLSRIDDAVLVVGEPGTGKEVVVRTIYHQSPRRGKPFVKINLAGLEQVTGPEGFFEFCALPSPSSGPTLDQALAAAAGGFLFLDDVGSLTPEFQEGLLGRFADGNGLTKPALPQDVRLILTGRDDLARQVHQGRFRKDLYFRMNAFTLQVPPLRQREEDIGLLADFFADRCCMQTGKGHFDLTTELKGMLALYPWPGNVRELQNAIRSAAVTGSERPIRDKLAGMIEKGWILPPSSFPQAIDRLVDVTGLRFHLKTQADLSLKNVCQVYIERIEQKLIGRTLERTNWNRREAARRLDISYKSILNKIKRYNLGPSAK